MNRLLAFLFLILLFFPGCKIRDLNINPSSTDKLEKYVSLEEPITYELNKKPFFLEPSFDLSFQFQETKLSDVIILVMDIVKKKYFVSASLKEFVTFNMVGNFKQSEILDMLNSLLFANRYGMQLQDDIYYIYELPEENLTFKNLSSEYDCYLYKMQYAVVDDLLPVLETVFHGQDVKFKSYLPLNSISIQTKSATLYASVMAVIEKLDKRPRQVLVDMTILEVELNNSMSHGVEYFLRTKQAKDTKNISVSLLPANIKSGFDPIASGVKLFSLTHDLDTIIDILQSVTKVKIISKPNIIVQDDKRSVIKIGRSEPIIRGTTLTATGLSQQSVDYKDVGLVLDVGVKIDENNMILINLKQELSDIVLVSLDPLIKSPSFTQKSIELDFLLKGNEKIYIGGMIQSNDSLTERSIPFVSKIPVVGNLFKSKESKKTESELLLVLSTRIIATDLDIYETTKRRINKYEIK